MARKVKCKFCKTDGRSNDFYCYEVTRYDKKKEKDVVSRSYACLPCQAEKEEELIFKAKEALELDDLYQYLLKLHAVEVIDGRMFARLQDLRNGSVTLNREKVKRYKEGITYSQILSSYEYSEKNIDYAIRTKQFKNKWNEFAYCFSIMVSKLNEVSSIKKRNEAVKIPEKVTSVDHTLAMTVRNKKSNNNKKDEMDLSEFL